jgi:hypothetical protein
MTYAIDSERKGHLGLGIEYGEIGTTKKMRMKKMQASPKAKDTILMSSKYDLDCEPAKTLLDFWYPNPASYSGREDIG